VLHNPTFHRDFAVEPIHIRPFALRPPCAWGRRPAAKPANQNGVTTGSDETEPAQMINPNPNGNPENLSTKGKARAQGAKPANAVTTGFGVESTGREVNSLGFGWAGARPHMV